MRWMIPDTGSDAPVGPRFAASFAQSISLFGGITDQFGEGVERIQEKSFTSK